MNHYFFEQYEGDEKPTVLTLINHHSVELIIAEPEQTIVYLTDHFIYFPVTPKNEHELGLLYANWYEEWRAEGNRDFDEPA